MFSYDAQYIFDTDGNLIPHVRGTSYNNFAFRYGGNQMASDNNETYLQKVKEMLYLYLLHIK